jgi:hypothetical protein
LSFSVFETLASLENIKKGGVGGVGVVYRETGALTRVLTHAFLGKKAHDSILCTFSTRRSATLAGKYQTLAAEYVIQHCFICCPSDSTLSADAGIGPRTGATSALIAIRSNHSARSHPLLG